MDKMEAALRAEIEWHRENIKAIGDTTNDVVWEWQKNEHRKRLALLSAALPAPGADAAGAISQATAERMREALDGCLHFSDAIPIDGALGKALRWWMKEARAALAASTEAPQ